MKEKIVLFITQNLLPLSVALTGLILFTANKLVNFGDLRRRLITVEGDMKDVKDDVKDIKTDLTGMKITLASIVSLLTGKVAKNSHGKTFFETGSPTHLNKEGLKMLKESGLKEIIERNKERLFELIESKNKRTIKDKNDVTEYDIECAAIEVAIFVEDATPMKQPKKYAFDNGINLNNMLTAAGLYLRNMYLREKRNVDINVSWIKDF